MNQKEIEKKYYEELITNTLRDGNRLEIQALLNVINRGELAQKNNIIKNTIKQELAKTKKAIAEAEEVESWAKLLLTQYKKSVGLISVVKELEHILTEKGKTIKNNIFICAKLEKILERPEGKERRYVIPPYDKSKGDTL